MTTLLLTPTPLELRVLGPLLSPAVGANEGRIELCGFGPIASAARSMQLIALYQPTHVVLVGIAGGLRPEFLVGTARNFQEVVCVGIGAGTGANHRSAGDIGWKHWSSAGATKDHSCEGIGDSLSLVPWLLTVCAAAANDADVAMRLARHPDAEAEEMEGFGVAVACSLAGVPLQIIRGISNRAGDRAQRNWDIEGALRAAAEVTLNALGSERGGSTSGFLA
ncbi:MAG: futalosine hydrolase [Planctomycetia bacterium]|nr:futalosine hydrolase [Planctomycetia bacterium]